MDHEGQPFIGSEALAAGVVSWHELGRYCRAIMPNVYLDNRLPPSLRQRILAAWLWSQRGAVIAGAAASALHGAKWVDDDTVVELIWRNARAPWPVGIPILEACGNWRRHWIWSMQAPRRPKKHGCGSC